MYFIPSHLLSIVVFKFVQLLRLVSFDGLQGHLQLLGLWRELFVAATAAEATTVAEKEINEGNK